ncbi:MAG: STAS domain-containing protein [Clostridia bacterium]|nr:STAS domain-containing protein [Clostridia bacterium]
MQEFKVKRESPELVIELSGEIDSGNADELYEEFIKNYKTPSKVVFECDKVEFIDSTTLGTFVKILKHVRSAGFTMKITGLIPRLKKLFVICSLDSIMEIS